MKTLRSKLLLAMLSIALIITVLLSLVSVYFINVSSKDTLKSTAEPLAVQAAKNFAPKKESDFTVETILFV